MSADTPPTLPCLIFPTWPINQTSLCHFPQQELRDLNRVGRGTFTKIVAHTPEGEPVGVRKIFPNSPNEHLIPIVAIDGHGVNLSVKIV
jgi:hypothetical protein